MSYKSCDPQEHGAHDAHDAMDEVSPGIELAPLRPFQCLPF
jgi:hypothetical protein